MTVKIKLFSRDDLNHHGEQKSTQCLTDIDFTTAVSVISRFDVCAYQDGDTVKIIKNRFNYGPRGGGIVKINEFAKFIRTARLLEDLRE